MPTVPKALRRVLIQSSSELIGNMVTDDKAAASIQIRYVTIVVATLPILIDLSAVAAVFHEGRYMLGVKDTGKNKKRPVRTRANLAYPHGLFQRFGEQHYKSQAPLRVPRKQLGILA